MRRVVIVGGGIAGLAAAFRLEQLRRDSPSELTYQLFEQAPRLGGVVRTEIADGCVVEGGPDSFLTEKPWATELCRELGLEDELIGSSDQERRTSILVRGRLLPIPDGVQFLVPTRLYSAAFSPLFSFGSKLRFLREWLSPPPPVPGDESVADFVRRHFGDEVVERLAAPLLNGVYGGDAARLSARAVLPRLVQLQARHGSLIRGMLAGRRAAAGAPLFTSLRRGMRQMVDALAARLDPAAWHTGAPVDHLFRRDGEWIVRTRTGETAADAVVLAVPAFASAALLAEAHPALAGELGAIPYSSAIAVVFAYDASRLPAEFRGFGFLVPAKERRLMLACTFVHNKFAHRAPPGRALLRCFIAAENAETAMHWEDGRIAGALRKELAEILHLDAAPSFTRVFRWPRAMAQYEVGHLQRLDRIEQMRRELPGLSLAGNAYGGIGVPDCVRTGTEAAVQAAGVPVQPETPARV